jgi:hypothetical protein
MREIYWVCWLHGIRRTVGPRVSYRTHVVPGIQGLAARTDCMSSTGCSYSCGEGDAAGLMDMCLRRRWCPRFIAESTEVVDVGATAGIETGH